MTTRPTRRAVFRVGGAGLLGLGYPQLHEAAASPSAARRATAKAVIFLHQWGGPGQHETFDPKPTAPDNVRFVGRVSDDDLPGLLAGARGLVFAGVEDFGITMVEAMAAGTPVIALDAGGARDSVEPGRSGLLFAEPTVASLVTALREAAATDWDRADVSASAHRFTEARFAAAMRDLAGPLVRG